MSKLDSYDLVTPSLYDNSMMSAVRVIIHGYEVRWAGGLGMRLGGLEAWV